MDVDVTEVSGATELTPHVDMADGIVDITSTGTTLRVNRLAVVDEVLVAPSACSRATTPLTTRR